MGNRNQSREVAPVAAKMNSGEPHITNGNSAMVIGDDLRVFSALTELSRQA